MIRSQERAWITSQRICNGIFWHSGKHIAAGIIFHCKSSGYASMRALGKQMEDCVFDVQVSEDLEIVNTWPYAR